MQELSSQCATVASQLLLPESSWRLRWPDPVALVEALERGRRGMEAIAFPCLLHICMYTICNMYIYLFCVRLNAVCKGFSKEKRKVSYLEVVLSKHEPRRV